MTRLLVFDSGIGGLSVAREVRRLLPPAEIVYVADDLGFPYGELADAVLTERVVAVIGALIGDIEPDAVVIACNTAATLVLPPLRARFSIPFVGTVPAIKPAAERTASGLVSVLATPGTMQRDYTRALIEEFAASCHVRLVGAARLASVAEAAMAGAPVDEAVIGEEIAPAFMEKDGRRTDTIVLACTHYPFLLSRFERLAPWPVAWIDPAPAIARRVVAVTGEVRGEGGGRACLTSGKAWAAPLGAFLREMGLEPAAGGPVVTPERKSA